MGYTIRSTINNEATGFIAEAEQLTWTDRFNGHAGWSLVGSTDVIAPLAEPGAGILIVDTDTDRIWSGHGGKVTDNDQENATIVGFGDLSFLAGRVPSPEPLTAYNPAAGGGSYATSSHDVLTGNGVDVIADLIDRNAGPAALAERRIPGLTIVKTGTGSAMTIRGRWAPTVLDLISEKATPNDIAVQIHSDGAGGYRCDIREAVVRSSAVFSQELLTLESWDRTTIPATATDVWGLGPGELTARMVRFGSRPDPISGRRIERAIDRTAATTIAELDAEIVEELELSRAKTSLKVTIVDQPGLRYGIDYLLGDRVPLRINGQEFTEPITEVTTSITAGETEPVRVVTIGFGLIEDPDIRTLVSQRQLAARLDSLEGRT